MDEPATTNQEAAAAASKKKSASVAEKPKSEKIRVELNIEKWPGIWQPAKAHTKLAVRTLERHVDMKDAGRAVSKLIIGFTDLGTLTTEDQRMFYALIRQWEDAGKPIGKPVYFSDRLLSRLLKKKGWGTNVIDAITGSLRRLRTIPLRWVKSFHKNDPAASEYEEEIPFQILGDLKIVTRKAHGHVTNQQGYFQFDRNIESNLHANYTKPLLDEVFLKIESEIAQLLYTHLDLIMFGKTRYERCTRELFADLGLTGASYRFKSNRKQKLERALQELQGVRLNHGVIKSAGIQETQDKKDFKVVFVKAARQELDVAETESLGEGTDVVVNHYAAAKDPLHRQADELVCYFHEVFHGVRNHEPQLKETNQALTLVGQHGLEQCRHIVNFAHRESQRSNYPVQHFGAILNYTSRALAGPSANKLPSKEQPVLEKRPPSTVVVEKPSESGISGPKRYPRGERRFSALSSEEQQARFERTRVQLINSSSSVAVLISQKPGSKLEQVTVRRLVIAELDQEPMELLVLGGSADPEAIRRKLGLQNLGV